MEPVLSRIDCKHSIGVTGYKNADETSPIVGYINNGIAVEIFDFIRDDKKRITWLHIRTSYNNPSAWVQSDAFSSKTLKKLNLKGE